MSDAATPGHSDPSVRAQVDHYRKRAAEFRRMADIEPLAGVRRHLRRLAAQYDEMAEDLSRQ
jgi:hypothetical protein